jgi:hypothetical protein
MPEEQFVSHAVRGSIRNDRQQHAGNQPSGQAEDRLTVVLLFDLVSLLLRFLERKELGLDGLL